MRTFNVAQFLMSLILIARIILSFLCFSCGLKKILILSFYSYNHILRIVLQRAWLIRWPRRRRGQIRIVEFILGTNQKITSFSRLGGLLVLVASRS